MKTLRAAASAVVLLTIYASAFSTVDEDEISVFIAFDGSRPDHHARHAVLQYLSHTASLGCGHGRLRTTYSMKFSLVDPQYVRSLKSTFGQYSILFIAG